MTQVVTFDAKIAAGHGNASGLTLITALTVSSIPFQEVQTVPRYSRGLARVTSTGLVRRAGYTSLEWKSSILWLPQFGYLVTTYEGAVTIRTRLGNNTYANYNAYLDCGDLSEYEPDIVEPYGNCVRDFIWKFTRVEAI